MLLNGRAPLPGELMTFPTLAQSFREIATYGKDGFYKGRVAEEIVKVVKGGGGVMELEDLAKHKTDFVDPIKYTYRDEVTVYEVSSMILQHRSPLKGLLSVLRTVKVRTSTMSNMIGIHNVASRNHRPDSVGHLGTTRSPRVGETITRDGS
jgi:gamma-glutamyltranspeptidase